MSLLFLSHTSSAISEIVDVKVDEVTFDVGSLNSSNNGNWSELSQHAISPLSQSCALCKKMNNKQKIRPPQASPRGKARLSSLGRFLQVHSSHLLSSRSANDEGFGGVRVRNFV